VQRVTEEKIKSNGCALLYEDEFPYTNAELRVDIHCYSKNN
jgi:hypothetical protein